VNRCNGLAVPIIIIIIGYCLMSFRLFDFSLPFTKILAAPLVFNPVEWWHFRKFGMSNIYSTIVRHGNNYCSTCRLASKGVVKRQFRHFFVWRRMSRAASTAASSKRLVISSKCGVTTSWTSYPYMAHYLPKQLKRARIVFIFIRRE